MDISAAIMAGALAFTSPDLSPGPGGFVGVEARVGWLSLGAEARGIFFDGGTSALAAATSGSAGFSGLLVPCLRWKVLLGCGFVGTQGLTFSTARGFETAHDGAQVFWGPRAGVDVPILGGFSLRGFADLTIQPQIGGYFGAGIAWSP